jgi:CzcA family heavy metal efflux pump
MLGSVIGYSLKFRFIVLALAAALMFFGFQRLQDMPVDVFPEFAPPRVEIQTPCLGLNPSDVEGLVTVPLEEALAGLPHLDILRSKSVPQLSSVLMIFKPGTDLLLARQLAAERIDTVKGTLPPDVGPPVMLQPLSATSRFMKIGITSEKYSVMDLSMITYWKIQQRLMTVPGVAWVAIWGERLKMHHVQVDPARLARENTSVEQILDVTANAIDAGLLQWSPGSLIGTGGFIDTPNQRLGVQFTLPIRDPVDLAQVSFTAGDGKVKRLGDVAEVKEDHQAMIGDGIIENDVGLLLIVEKFPWANTLQVTRGVENALDELRAGLPDVKIDHEIFRPATFIETSIDNLTQALLIGCILVVLVLVAFLYEWRVALISCVAIPLSLMAGAMVLYVRGTTINTMILAGFVIALGAVVDDAIVDIENIMRRLRLARKEGSSKSLFRVIVDASLEVRSAIIYSTLIEILALLPVFFMEGLSGAFFKPLAMSYALAIAASTIVALTVTPAMAYILLRNAPLHRRESPLVAWLHRRYDFVLTRIIRSPRPAYVGVAIVVLAGVIVLPQLGQQLLPSFKERDFLMHWLTKPGTSLPEMDRITIQSAKDLRAIPGVRNFGAHIGQALIMDEVVGIYFGENWISVDPAVDYWDTVNEVQAVVDAYPGIYRDVLTYLKERIREVLTGSSESINVRLYGHDLPTLYATGRMVRDAMQGIEGAIDLHVDLQEDIPNIEIEINLEKAKKYGLKPGDVRRNASILMAGWEAGDLFHGGKAYDVQVWSVPEVRHSLSALKELLIDVPGGGQVELQEVADVRIAPVPNVIAREQMKRRLDVGCNVRGRDLGSVASDVEKAIATVDFPKGVHAELIGEYAERQKAQNRLFGLAIIACLGIFVLLHTSFGSGRLALLSFLLLPSALVGGVIAAYLGDGIISLGSLVGFLTVLGIAARNGILMIKHFEHLEDEEGMKFGPDLVRRGAQERLAPILMTATTTGLALLPLVIRGDIPGHEIELPMAVVILGGLVTSTLLNLFIIPSLYLRFGRGPAPAAARVPFGVTPEIRPIAGD